MVVVATTIKSLVHNIQKETGVRIEYEVRSKRVPKTVAYCFRSPFIRSMGKTLKRDFGADQMRILDYILIKDKNLRIGKHSCTHNVMVIYKLPQIFMNFKHTFVF